MRYIIGCEMIDKLKDNPFIEDKSVKGIYVINYLPYILDEKTDENFMQLSKVKVFDDLEKAKKEVSSCAKAYRRDDVAFRPSQKSRYIRHFYLLKLDSPKCPIIIDEKTKEMAKDGNYCFYKILKRRI